MPGERIELPTNGLQNRCSTAELTRQINDLGLPGYFLGTGFRSPYIHAELSRRKRGGGLARARGGIALAV